jgi:hypothetical protein
MSLRSVLLKKAASIFFNNEAPVFGSSYREELYHSRIFFKRIVLFYQDIQQKLIQNKVASTYEKMNPLGLYMGAKTIELSDEWNKPKYKFTNGDNYEVQVHKLNISNLSMLVQLQFFEDKLFFISIGITNLLRNEAQKAEVINTIIRKYLYRPYQPGTEYPVIKDVNGNIILVDDDVHFTICYFDGKYLTKGLEKLQQTLLSAAICDPQIADFERHRDKLFDTF